MFVFWYFTLYTILLLNGKYFSTGVTVIMVFYAVISDLLLYSLASQWVKKTRPNSSKPVIMNKHIVDPRPKDATDNLRKIDKP